MEIREFLRGYRPAIDSVQVAGNMAVVPLVSDQEFTTAVGDVGEVSLKKDINYGTLCFENQGGRVGIVLQGATIITQQSAQDRTVPRAVILKGKEVANVNAFCVQSSQGGYIKANQLTDEFGDESPFMIMPPTLRANALVQSAGLGRGSDYSRLWNSLENYSGTFAGVRSSSALKDIYAKYKDQLDEFVAQFEPIPNQLGAIVLIDGAVVAVDIMPTYHSWKRMWRGLIRDSYGVEAVRTADDSKGVVFNYNLNIDNITDLDSLETEMERATSNLTGAIRQQWNAVDKATVTVKQTKKIGDVSLKDVSTDKFFGQAVIHDEHCVYLSLVPKGSTPGTGGNFRRRSRIYGDDDFSF
jgi:hypothetical protein